MTLKKKRKKTGPRARPRRPLRPARSCFAIGDPQSTFDRFRRILDYHELLGTDQKLRRGVSLLSIGDHFDYSSPDPEAAGREGLRILRWLAAHPPEQAIILAGNHDTARVTELAGLSEADFREARARALQVDRLPAGSPERAEAERSFSKSFPDLPTSESARRDYQTFSPEQRDLVRELLLSGRMRLAQAGILFGRPGLLTHTGVTRRELDLLGLAPEADCGAIARALNDRLDRALSETRSAGSEGRPAPLDLGPLSVGGKAGREGGGFLYHRPAGTPDAANPAPLARRRFHPSDLPASLVQVCGHTIHKKCILPRQLGSWTAPRALGADLREIRVLRVRGDRIRYDAAREAPKPGEAVLFMIDGAMNGVPRPSAYPLLRLDGWEDA